MKDVQIDISEDLLPLTLKVEINGKTIFKKRADSFLSPYMRLMRSFFAGEACDADFNLVRSLSNNTFGNAQLKIDIVSIVSGKLRLQTSSSHGMSTGNVAYVMGVNGISGGDPNGFQAVTFISTTVVELTDLSGLSGTHVEATSNAYLYRGTVQGLAWRSQDETFGRPQIRVGDGTSSNTATTGSLEYEIPSAASLTGARTLDLQSTNPTINTPSVGATQSTIEVIQAFTNNSGATIAIEEVGLWAKFIDFSTSDQWYTMICRDLLPSTINLLDTETLTVTYELNTDVPSTAGGILIQWNEIFYRQLAQTTREAKDIFNNNKVKGDIEGQFYLNSHGGDTPISVVPVSSTSNESYRIGPRVGTSTNNVVNTDFRLQDGTAANTAIEHGVASGEFYHYGAEIGFVQVSGTQLTVEITRIFENRSGGTITVNEVGLYAGYVVTAGVVPAIEDVHCLARHVVTAVTVNDTEFLKVTYSIVINV